MTLDALVPLRGEDKKMKSESSAGDKNALKMILSVCIVENHWSWNLLSFDAFPLVPHLGNNWLSVGRISANCDSSISKFSLASLRFRMADSGDRLNAVPGGNPERVLFQFVELTGPDLSDARLQYRTPDASAFIVGRRESDLLAFQTAIIHPRLFKYIHASFGPLLTFIKRCTQPLVANTVQPLIVWVMSNFNLRTRSVFNQRET
ncbi:hypothetical protein B0H14DRAFT_3145792 [Mycena olivaceomarginata]|nr:hypothetical protein B0H14DRAFT_3145792 [Mycena olivaceomarginata]